MQQPIQNPYQKLKDLVISGIECDQEGNHVEVEQFIREHKNSCKEISTQVLLEYLPHVRESEEHLQCITHLLKQSINLEIKDGSGKSLLINIIMAGNISVVKKVLEFYKLNKYQITQALDHAVQAKQDNWDVVEVLLNELGKHKEKPKAEFLKKALLSGNLKTCQILIERVAIQEKDADGNTVQHHAARLGQKEIIQLISQKNPTLLAVRNKYQQLPIDLAAEPVKELLRELAIKYNSPTKNPNEKYKTPPSQGVMPQSLAESQKSKQLTSITLNQFRSNSEESQSDEPSENYNNGCNKCDDSGSEGSSSNDGEMEEKHYQVQNAGDFEGSESDDHQALKNGSAELSEDPNSSNPKPESIQAQSPENQAHSTPKGQVGLVQGAGSKPEPSGEGESKLRKSPSQSLQACENTYQFSQQECAALVLEAPPLVPFYQTLTLSYDSRWIPTLDDIYQQLTYEINTFGLEMDKYQRDRKSMINNLVTLSTQAISELYPKSKVFLYGSCKTELFIVDSDIDLVMELSQPADRALTLSVLNELSEAFRKKNFIQEAKLIEGGSMPVLKLKCAQEYEHKFIDISILTESHTGAKTAELISNYLKEYPQLRYIALVLKHYFKQINLLNLYEVASVFYKRVD